MELGCTVLSQLPEAGEGASTALPSLRSCSWQGGDRYLVDPGIQDAELAGTGLGRGAQAPPATAADFTAGEASAPRSSVHGSKSFPDRQSRGRMVCRQPGLRSTHTWLGRELLG